MIKQLGPRTLFVTCSTAEWFSAALIEHLRTINKDADTNVDKMTPAELCALDPVTASIHFHKKWHSRPPTLGRFDAHFEAELVMHVVEMRPTSKVRRGARSAGTNSLAGTTTTTRIEWYTFDAHEN